MNRRGFVKVLTGIPLLGLLVRVPGAEAALDVAALQKALAGMSKAATLLVPCLQSLAESAQNVRWWIPL